MTFNPPTLQALGSFWTGQGGVNLGVVGDTAHMAKGYSYHLGADDLVSTAYSIKTARDRAGLTNAASAIDLGKLDGSYGKLRDFSKWLVARARSNAPGTSDMREIIFSPDGAVVLRWDRERGFGSAPRTGEADDSHLYHTHISWYRDAERRDHTTAFRPYFVTEEGMNSFTVPKVPQVGIVSKGAVLFTSDALDPTDPGRIIIDPARTMPYLGFTKSTVRIVAYVDEAGVNTGKAMYLAAGDITGIVATAGGDCTAAVKAATDPLKAQIATLTADVAGAKLAGAREEWERQKAGATVVPKLLDRP